MHRVPRITSHAPAIQAMGCPVTHRPWARTPVESAPPASRPGMQDAGGRISTARLSSRRGSDKVAFEADGGIPPAGVPSGLAAPIPRYHGPNRGPKRRSIGFAKPPSVGKSWLVAAPAPPSEVRRCIPGRSECSSCRTRIASDS